MNLEDRLRSHLHSGPDMIDAPSTTAADLTAAGNRRTQRNRVMVGGAAALTAFVLVGGALTLAGGGTDDSDELVTGQEEAATSTFDGDDAIEEDFGGDGEPESSMTDAAIASDDTNEFDQPPPRVRLHRGNRRRLYWSAQSRWRNNRPAIRGWAGLHRGAHDRRPHRRNVR